MVIKTAKTVAEYKKIRDERIQSESQTMSDSSPLPCERCASGTHVPC